MILKPQADELQLLSLCFYTLLCHSLTSHSSAASFSWWHRAKEVRAGWNIGFHDRGRWIFEGYLTAKGPLLGYRVGGGCILAVSLARLSVFLFLLICSPELSISSPYFFYSAWRWGFAGNQLTSVSFLNHWPLYLQVSFLLLPQIFRVLLIPALRFNSSVQKQNLNKPSVCLNATPPLS